MNCFLKRASLQIQIAGFEHAGNEGGKRRRDRGETCHMRVESMRSTVEYLSAHPMTPPSREFAAIYCNINFG